MECLETTFLEMSNAPSVNLYRGHNTNHCCITALLHCKFVTFLSASVYVANQSRTIYYRQTLAKRFPGLAQAAVRNLIENR